MYHCSLIFRLLCEGSHLQGKAERCDYKLSSTVLLQSYSLRKLLVGVQNTEISFPIQAQWPPHCRRSIFLSQFVVGPPIFPFQHYKNFESFLIDRYANVVCRYSWSRPQGRVMMVGLQSISRLQVLKTIEKKANDRKLSPWSLLRPSSPRTNSSLQMP